MIKLLGDKVAVLPIRDPDKSQGGIIIPDMAKERTDQGIVKYVGPKVKVLKKGDYVLFSGYSGTVVRFELDADGTLILIREKFVTAILNNPDTEVRGLYFKSKWHSEELRDNIKKHVIECIGTPSNTSDNDIKICVNKIFMEVVGEDPYFPATYEMAMNLIAESFEGTEFSRGTGFKNVLDSKPLVEEYNEVEEDEEIELTEIYPSTKE